MDPGRRAETSHNAQALAAAVLDGTLTFDEASDAWCASGWQPPHGLIGGAFDERGRWLLRATGRRKPVVGNPRRDEQGWFYAPANTNARRREDAALLNGVASAVGMTARIPRNGRPRRGRGEAAARYVEREVSNGVPRPKAVQAAYEEFGWHTESIERHLRRRRTTLGDQ